jgi:hypothetical protein
VFVSGSGLAQPTTPADLLRRNQESLDAIFSYHCKIRPEVLGAAGKPAPFQYPAGEYWRSPRGVRFEWRSSDQSGTIVVRDGVVKTLTRQGKNLSGTILRQESQIVGQSDPWHRSFFLFPDLTKKGDRDYLPLAEFHQRMDAKGRFRAVERSEKDPANPVLVYQGDATIRVTLDASKNYLVRSYEGAKSPESKGVTELVRFREVKKGIFVPEEMITRFYHKDVVQMTERFVLSDFKVNEGIAENLFDLTFPPSTEVQDLIRSRGYRIGSDGRKGEENLLAVIPPPLLCLRRAMQRPRKQPRSRHRSPSGSFLSPWVYLPSQGCLYWSDGCGARNSHPKHSWGQFANMM